MSQYKIVIDSCGELPEDLKADGHFCTVPLLLDVDGYQITDDETFNIFQEEFKKEKIKIINSLEKSLGFELPISYSLTKTLNLYKEIEGKK